MRLSDNPVYRRLARRGRFSSGWRLVAVGAATLLLSSALMVWVFFSANFHLLPAISQIGLILFCFPYLQATLRASHLTLLEYPSEARQLIRLTPLTRAEENSGIALAAFQRARLPMMIAFALIPALTAALLFDGISPQGLDGLRQIITDTCFPGDLCDIRIAYWQRVEPAAPIIVVSSTLLAMLGTAIIGAMGGVLIARHIKPYELMVPALMLWLPLPIAAYLFGLPMLAFNSLLPGYYWDIERLLWAVGLTVPQLVLIVGVLWGYQFGVGGNRREIKDL